MSGKFIYVPETPGINVHQCGLPSDLPASLAPKRSSQSVFLRIPLGTAWQCGECGTVWRYTLSDYWSKENRFQAWFRNRKQRKLHKNMVKFWETHPEYALIKQSELDRLRLVEERCREE